MNNLLVNLATIQPQAILTEIAQSQGNGCLKVSFKSFEYFIYCQQGQISYATNSLETFERLERHLRNLSHTNSHLTGEVRKQARLNFETQKIDPTNTPPDYQAIAWLLQKKYINQEEAEALVKSLTQEVCQSYLLLTDIEYEFIEHQSKLKYFGNFDVVTLIEECRRELENWYSLAPEITSSYQRPYCASKSELDGIEEKFRKILIGFSFSQLGVLLNQEPLKVAQTLHPLIVKGKIALREPQTPLNQLPTIANFNFKQSEISQEKNPQSKHKKIACVDDSPTILQEIGRFLSGQNMEVFTLNDSFKAFREIMRIKPDLILLDVSMPKVDGYKLCRVIRNHSLFKNTPIVMVTGNGGNGEREKAKVAGSNDYMTKPFTQPELLQMVHRYI